MKVLVGHFTTESNGNIPYQNDITAYDIEFGEDCINKSEVRDIFENEGIEIIPSVYASGGPSGIIRRNAFDYIESCFINAVKEHLHEIDGIYLWLHGAGEVAGLGSADHHILAEIRKITGPYLPICVSCDPHGNLTKEYVEMTQAIRSFRESPHTDDTATKRIVAGYLVRQLKHRTNVHSIYRKLPLILGGEQSVSADEPVRSINAYMDEMEKDPRVLSASWHVGYIRHDCACAGCGIVVVPANEQDMEYCEQKADELAEYVWNKRHEFHYTGLSRLPEEALQMVLDFDGGRAVLTDSGDNTSSGAAGWNTYVLRQFLDAENLTKKVLFASICDPNTYDQLKNLPIGTSASIHLGMNHDALSQSVPLQVTVKAKGEVIRLLALQTADYKHKGDCVTVTIHGTPIDIIITNSNQCYTNKMQFDFANVDWNAYDILVVKQGYIFPELKAHSQFSVMSLTEGPTLQDTSRLPFKLIMRPMFPIDDI
ncbi:MAG: M81 family metallopeptidase [Erysipelotrichaceae bacterium]|nr:M81 family metallopeptidase [Erysipelotrichaceae bacterium]